MPKAIGVSDADYEYVRSQRKVRSDNPEEKETLVEALHRIIEVYKNAGGTNV